MTAIRPSKIEAAMLYQDYETFSFRDLAARFELIFGKHMHVGLGHHEDHKYAVMRIGGHTVLISQNQQPLGLAGFEGALASHYTGIQHPQAKGIVRGHRKNIFVTVGGDEALVPDDVFGNQSPEMQKLIRDVLPDRTPDTALFSNRVFLARMIVSTISNFARPDLIHWCQSDQFFTAEEFEPLKDPRGMEVQIHPNIFSSGKNNEGHTLIGFHAFGAEHVMGHHVIVQETPLYFKRVLPMVQDLIYAIYKSGDLPQSGSVVRPRTGGELRVTLVPADNNYPRPYLSVEVLSLGEDTDQARHTPQHPRPAAPQGKPATDVFATDFKSFFKGGAPTAAAQAKPRRRLPPQAIWAMAMGFLVVQYLF